MPAPAIPHKEAPKVAASANVAFTMFQVQYHSATRGEFEKVAFPSYFMGVRSAYLPEGFLRADLLAVFLNELFLRAKKGRDFAVVWLV